jgi:RNA polymerase subunit RPABC4/transcription elongation factor Spt4
MCTQVVGAVSVDAVGFPTKRGSDRGRESVIAFSCAGAVFLTSQRLVGLLLEGESVLGDIDGTGAGVVVFTMPLADISVATLQRRARGKERGVALGTVAGGSLFIDIDRVVDERDRARRQQKSDGMRTILTAIAEAWRVGVSAQDPELLRRALEGAWLADGDDLVAPLARLDLPHGVQAAPPAPRRQTDPVSRACPACGASLRPDARFCPGCGSPVQSAGVVGGVRQDDSAAQPPTMCRACGAVVPRGRRYCGNCGAAL